MLQFESDKDFPSPPADVWARLTDARFLVTCIPDVAAVKEVSADRALLTLRPGFAFVRGTLETTLEIVDKVEPTSARMVLSSRGIGSSSKVEAILTLTPHEDGTTHVHSVAMVSELGGLLKLVPSGLIRGAAQKVIADAWTAAEAKMNTR